MNRKGEGDGEEVKEEWRGKYGDKEGRRVEWIKSGEEGVVKIAFWNVAEVGNKDEGFWKRMVEWDIVIMSEMWMEKKGWQRMKGRLPKEFR